MGAPAVHRSIFEEEPPPDLSRVQASGGAESAVTVIAGSARPKSGGRERLARNTVRSVSRPMIVSKRSGPDRPEADTGESCFEGGRVHRGSRSEWAWCRYETKCLPGRAPAHFYFDGSDGSARARTPPQRISRYVDRAVNPQSVASRPDTRLIALAAAFARRLSPGGPARFGSG